METTHEADVKANILNFIKSNQLAVISTIDSSGEKPEAAVIGFAKNDKLEIIFGTPNTSRKYKNLQKNPRVALAIGWAGNVGTVQYEGIAREVSKEESQEYIKILVAKNPFAEKFISRDDERFFVVIPTWIRIVDMSKHPNEISEVSF